MGLIRYNFNNAGTCAAMSKCGGQVAAFPGPVNNNNVGMYIIQNHTPIGVRVLPSVYVGIAGGVGGLAGRWLDRVRVVGEMGFTNAELADILLWSGTAEVQNTPGYNGNMAPALMQANYATGIGNIDGQDVNVERVLVRCYINGLMGNCEIMNANYAGPVSYDNPTGSPITIEFISAANAPVLASNFQQVWAVGEEI